MPSILYQEFDTDMFYQVPTQINITKYIDLKSFLISIGREDLATKPYLSNKDMAEIIAFVKKIKKSLDLTHLSKDKQATQLVFSL